MTRGLPKMREFHTAQHIRQSKISYPLYMTSTGPNFFHIFVGAHDWTGRFQPNNFDSGRRGTCTTAVAFASVPFLPTLVEIFFGCQRRSGPRPGQSDGRGRWKLHQLGVEVGTASTGVYIIGLEGPFADLPFGICATYFDLNVYEPLKIHPKVV